MYASHEIIGGLRRGSAMLGSAEWHGVVGAFPEPALINDACVLTRPGEPFCAHSQHTSREAHLEGAEHTPCFVISCLPVAAVPGAAVGGVCVCCLQCVWL